MTQKPEIRITQSGLGAILKQFNLKVPSHQRDYSWTEKEVTKLFQDLAKAIAARFEPKEASQSFQMFISLGVRLIIASTTRSGFVEETLASVANKIFLGKITTTSDLRTAIAGMVPSDEQFRMAFENATVSKAPFARYYLRTLDRVVKGEPFPWFTVPDDKESITLEHVLPQNTEGYWPQFSGEQIDTHYKRLGNMVLLHRKTNSDLKSIGFAFKRSAYQECPYELTSQVGRVENWNVETICKRQKAMAELAIKAWPI